MGTFVAGRGKVRRLGGGTAAGITVVIVVSFMREEGVLDEVLLPHDVSLAFVIPIISTQSVHMVRTT